MHTCAVNACVLLSDITCYSWVVNTSFSYSGYLGIDFRPGSRLSWLGFFILFLCPSKQILTTATSFSSHYSISFSVFLSFNTIQHIALINVIEWSNFKANLCWVDMNVPWVACKRSWGSWHTARECPCWLHPPGCWTAELGCWWQDWPSGPQSRSCRAASWIVA